MRAPLFKRKGNVLRDIRSPKNGGDRGSCGAQPHPTIQSKKRQISRVRLKDVSDSFSVCVCEMRDKLLIKFRGMWAPGDGDLEICVGVLKRFVARHFVFFALAVCLG